MQTGSTNRLDELLSLTGLIDLLRRRLWLAAGALLVLFGAGAVLILTTPSEYRAGLRLIVKRARAERPVDANGVATAAVPDVTDAQIASEIQLYRSRASLEEAVKHCHLVDEFNRTADDNRTRAALAVQQLEDKLQVRRVGKTNLIEVEYSHRDAERAAEVVRTLTDRYLAKHLEVHRQEGASGFFAEQAELHHKNLREAQDAVADFRSRHKVSSLDAEKQAKLQRQNELEKLLQETNSEIEDVSDRVGRLRSQVASLPATIETSARSARNQVLIERLKTSLLQLENKRTELLTKYDENYRLVREVNQQIADTRSMLENEMEDRVVDRTQAVNPLRQSIEGDLLRTETQRAGLEAKRDATARDLEQVRQELSRLEALTAEHDNLVRGVTLAEGNYLLYKQKLEESRLEDAMDQQRILNVSVVEDAAVPVMPADQHKAVLLVLCALMAGFGSLGLVLAVDLVPPQTRPGRPATEITKTAEMEFAGANGTRASASAEAMVDPQPAGAQQAERQPVNGHAKQVMALSPLQLTPKTPQAGEVVLRAQFDPIIDSVNRPHPYRRGVAIGLSPDIRPEEATSASVQLAESLHRRNGLPTLLIDGARADRPVSSFFDLAEAPGLTELLSAAPGAEKRFLHRTKFSNLWILPHGKWREDQSTALERVDALRRTLADCSMNLVVYLPDGASGPVGQMTYSILDIVISSLKDEDGKSIDVTELVRRVVEAKRSFSERRVTLVGSAGQWSKDEAESLIVC